MRKLYYGYISWVEAQLRWMRRHPRQYVALNVIPIIGLIAYYWWEERREDRHADFDELVQQWLKDVEPTVTVTGN